MSSRNAPLPRFSSGPLKRHASVLRWPPHNGRWAAFAALLLVDDGMSAQEAVEAARLALAGAPGRGGPRPDAEAALCAELAYGCLRLEMRLDAILGRVLPRPSGLPAPMRILLRLAVYGLLFLDGVPDHAVVHGAVDRVRALYGARLARVANGALRSVQRLGDAPRRLDFYQRRQTRPGADNALEALALFHSVPLSIARLWRRAYGSETALRLMRRSSARPRVSLRVNARHAQAAALLEALRACGGAAVGGWGVGFAPGALPRDALGRPLPRWMAEGAVSFQAAGSQLVLERLALGLWDAPVWDACAGVGGKTLALLERGVPVALASDLSASRLRLLPEQADRLGLAAPLVVRANAARPPLARWPGHILLDVPCSGLGVLARRPDIRRRPPSALEDFVRTQSALLDSAAALLPSGGELAYVTCTLRPEENEMAMAFFLRRHDGFALDRQWATPSEHPWLEGMYGAVLRRR